MNALLNSLLLLAVLVAMPCHAIHWEVIGQNSKFPVFQGFLEIDLKKSVGRVSIEVLNEKRIPYIGNEAGLNSILGTPTGDALMVILNDDQMLAYGWCFDIDGIQPDLMPDKVYFKSQESRLRWFFAYTFYDKGVWKDFCTPAYQRPL